MMSSTGSEETYYNSSSWSSSTTTPPSPFSQATPRSRTMEEVWKDINLASLSNANNSPNFRNMTLQDFLARPFANVVSPTPDHHHHNNNNHITLNSPPPPPPPPPPATVLSLNHLDSDQFQLFCIENLNTTRPFVNLNHPNTSTVSEKSFNGAYPFEGLGSQSSPSPGLVMPSGFGYGNERLPEPDDRSNFGGGDRRHKRMIKNRESAARSRARKQAYTNDLEIRIQLLMEENERLRRENEQLSDAAASQLPKKHSLNRSSTAPF